MIRAISVESRPRTLPSASMMNHFGSMSPCLGKYVRMTLLNTPRNLEIRSSEDRGAGENCSAPNVIQRQPHTFPAEGGETVTLPNRARQGIHSRRFGSLTGDGLSVVGCQLSVVSCRCRLSVVGCQQPTALITPSEQESHRQP